MRLRTGGIWALAACLAALVAQPAAARDKPAAPPRPAIWLVEDSDTRIYLLGTIHILPPGFHWRSAAIERLIGQADELVVEDYTPPGVEESMDAMLRETPLPLLGRVPEDRRPALAAAVRKSGFPRTMYDVLQSWAAAMMLDIGLSLKAMGIEDPTKAPGVEDQLEAAFRAAGKPIGSVEESDEVLAAMSAMPETAQVEMLLIIAEDSGTGASAFQEDLAHWRAGRDEKMAVLPEDDFPAEAYEILLKRRNAAWTKWLAERLDRPGTVLFAVGAAHLAGADSVQKMLAARGLEAKRFD